MAPLLTIGWQSQDKGSNSRGGHGGHRRLHRWNFRCISRFNRRSARCRFKRIGQTERMQNGLNSRTVVRGNVKQREAPKVLCFSCCELMEHCKRDRKLTFWTRALRHLFGPETADSRNAGFRHRHSINS